MLEHSFNIFLKSIDAQIDINDFNTIESTMKNSLRFELGDDLNNGTKKRVKQATERAQLLFQECFNKDTFIFLLSYDWKDEFLGRTPDYLYEIVKFKRFSSQRELATRYFNNEKPEYAVGTLSIYEMPFDKLDYFKIFKGIANSEMGLDPCIHQIVYFFGKTSGKVFWMYDDRGCLIMSQDIKVLKPEFEKYKGWLCGGYEELFINKIKNCC